MERNEDHKTFHFKTRQNEEYQIGDHGNHLKLTTERLAESAKNQAEWNNSPHITVSPQMAHVQRARREAIEWLQAGRAVELELHRPNTTKAERKNLNVRFNHLMTLLAEALATCGNYAEALMVLPKHRVDLRREMEAVYKAIERPDDERCDEECEKAFTANPTVVTRERVHKYVFSVRHGAIIPVIACTSCGALNARPADGALAKQMEARARAVELTKGESPKEAKRILTEARLTSEHVLKIV